MDIDKMFKIPNLPSKRKMAENPSPEMLKRLKVETPGFSESKGKSRAVTIEDEPEQEDVEMDTSFAPGGDPDYFAEEDEDGRFYGGGLNSQQKDIMNIFDKAGGEGVVEDADELSPTSIRRLLTRFERAVLKNQDQRSKYPDDPTKFIDSEADLDAALKSLLPLAQAPVVAYPELVKSGTIAHLIGLLSHENLDIVIDVVEVVHELTDEDVGNEEEVDEEEERTAEDALKQLIQALLDNSILELLVDNLARLNEAEESDRQGVFHILGIFENTLGFDPALSAQLVTKTSIMTWLLNRIQGSKHDENRGYSAELLSILLQNNQSNRLEFAKKDGVETFLKVLSQYRRKEPKHADETEFMENLFDALCSALSESSIKEMFLKAEGPDLMVLMMKEKNHATSLAIKTLDYSMSGPSGFAVCEAFIEALGLKALFSAFMGKTGKKPKSSGTAVSSEDTTHILGILSSLFSSIPSESTGRIRLLAKFVEGNYEKVDKLLEIRDNAKHRLTSTEAEIETEKKEMLAEGDEPGEVENDLWYLRRLEGGQFTLQSVDYILAWLVMEDDGIRAHVTQMLSRRNNTIADIVKTLRLYHDNVGDEATLDDPDTLSQKEILHNLIDVLEKL